MGSTSRLEGRRLKLRPLESKDADALYEAVESTRAALKRRLGWVSGIEGPKDEARFIELAGSAAAKENAVVWGVFELRSENIAGVASIDGLEGSPRGTGRFGLWIRAERQDKGFAVEAGRLVVDYAFRRTGRHRLFAKIDPTNRPFRKVLKKLGFKYEGCLRLDQRINGRWVDQECWGMLKDEWKK